MANDSSAKEIYGLIGYPVKHSLSPAMHNAAFRHLNINAEYRLFEVPPERLQDFLLEKDKIFEDTAGRRVRAGDVLGFNITIPHKIKAREILENKFPYNQNVPKLQENLYYVKLSGAVNTVKRGVNQLEYWNTDATGFWRSLTQKEHLCLGFNPKGKNIFVLGCGGAGRAIIASLSWINVGVKNLYINDINDEAVNSAREYFLRLPQYPHLKRILKFVSIKDMAQVIEDCQLLINASPVGMKDGDGSIVDKSLLRNDLFVYDLVYNRETQLIKNAKSQEALAVSGLGMLFYQGVDAFNLWTDGRAPVEVMREALLKAL